MAMLVKLTAQGGPLWNVWVAAHVERRLKRQDQLCTDVRAAVSTMLEHMGDLPLRCIGQLILGLCRILRWQAIAFEEQAEEVRDQLNLSLSSGPGLPVVAPKSAAALTLRFGAPNEASAFEFGVAGNLLLLQEPDLQEISLEASLLQGRRHVAPLELITLSDDAVAPDLPVLMGLEAAYAGEAFGAPSQEDLQAMEALSQATAGSAKRQKTEHQAHASSEEDDPPPLDFLLGAGSGRGDALSPQLDAAAEIITPTPKRLVRALDFDAPELGSGFGTEAGTRSPLLPKLIELSPPKLVAPLRQAAAADEVESEVGPPAKKPRTRKPRPWMDETTQIPLSVYHNSAPITLSTEIDYRVFLPHRSFHLGLTTSMGDICELLAEPLRNAASVALKRRHAIVEAAKADKEHEHEQELHQHELASQGRTPAGRSPPRPAYGVTPIGRMAEELFPDSPARATSSALRVASPMEVDAGAVLSPGLPSPGLPVACSPAEQRLPSPGLPAALSPVEQRLRSPDPAAELSPVQQRTGPAMPSPGSLRPSPGRTPQHAMVAVEGTDWDADMQLVEAGEAPGVKTEEDVTIKLEPTEATDIKHILESKAEHETISFLELCNNGAEDGARRFLSLLTMHMDGILSLNQDEPYGDITIGRGPDWISCSEVRYQ